MPSVDSRYSSKTLFTSSSRNFKTIKFEDTTAAQPPRIAVPQGKFTRPASIKPSSVSIAKSKVSPGSSVRSSVLKRRSQFSEDVRRDSGMAPTISTMGHESVAEPVEQHPQANGAAHSIPAIHLNDEPQDDAQDKIAQSDKQQADCGSQAYEEPPEVSHQDATVGEEIPHEHFTGISTEIPTGDFDDPFASDEITFSKRGSVLWSGKKANAASNAMAEEGRRQVSKDSSGSTHRFSSITLSPAMSRAQSRMSFDDRRLSQRVRSMYDFGDEKIGELSERPLSELIERNPDLDHASGDDTVGELPRIGSPRLGHYGDDSSSMKRSSSALSRRSSFIKKEPWEVAGGIEDWRDVESGDVDRYGFIKSQKKHQRSRGTSMGSTTISEEPERPGTQGSNSQKAPAAVPRPRKLRRPPYNSANRSSVASGGSRTGNLHPGRENTPSVASSRSMLSIATSVSALNRSSHQNRGRSWANEAPTMLTSQLDPHENAARALNEPVATASTPLERKREVKWEKMAKRSSQAHRSQSATQSAPVVGGGATYYFDRSNPKVISRTWKGIPNRWRSAAWHSFLTSSAKNQFGRDLVPDDILIDRFHALQSLDCIFDPQIDLDVPRTIGDHIMFRARYRGGQRLLFRVLRALALQFPTSGYVQGMAPLVATLLCYYDEEQAFVMGVRMWECRGLKLLYSPGFQGLFTGLADFEKNWLSAMGVRVRDKLQEHGVTTSAYGTKWYLTLFCYTLPYEVQLRVWDVYMLLGEPSKKSRHQKKPKVVHVADNGSKKDGTKSKAVKEVKKSALKDDDEEPVVEVEVPEGQFDCLHAVSAALIDALQPTLLDTDFDAVMQALTSHIPIGKADVLMSVARREWAERKKRARGHFWSL